MREISNIESQLFEKMNKIERSVQNRVLADVNICIREGGVESIEVIVSRLGGNLESVVLQKLRE